MNNIPCCNRCGEELTINPYHMIADYTVDDDVIWCGRPKIKLCDECYQTFNHWANCCHGWDE